MQDKQQQRLKQTLHQHEGELLRYAYRLLGNDEVAQDIVQDAFLKLWQKPPKNDTHLRAWLFKVCHNLVVDRKRKEQHMAKFTDEQSVHQKPHTYGGLPAAEPEQEESKLKHALNALTEKQREMVRLKFQNGFSYAEIAHITGTSMNNVGNTLHKAMQKLRESMNQNQETATERGAL